MSVWIWPPTALPDVAAPDFITTASFRKVKTTSAFFLDIFGLGYDITFIPFLPKGKCILCGRSWHPLLAMYHHLCWRKKQSCWEKEATFYVLVFKDSHFVLIGGILFQKGRNVIAVGLANVQWNIYTRGGMMVSKHSWCNGYFHECGARVVISITSLFAGYHHTTTRVHFPLHIRQPHSNTTLYLRFMPWFFFKDEVCIY